MLARDNLWGGVRRVILYSSNEETHESHTKKNGCKINEMQVTSMTISEILNEMDKKDLTDNEFKNLLMQLDEEIGILRLPDKKILLDKNENTTILMEIRGGKRELVKLTDIQPMTIMHESEGLQTIPFSAIRKYVTKKNIEALLPQDLL